MSSIIRALPIGIVAAVGFALSLPAQSATISRDFSGNDCSGYFGQGFDACTIFINVGGQRIELSPVIAKFGDSLAVDETNDSVFPSIDGSEFGFSNTTTDNKTGDWTYTPGVDDPGVRYWSTKAGPNFKLFWEVDNSALASGGACDVADVYALSCLNAALVLTAGSWTTPSNKELSHIVFYDSVAATIVPVPAAVWLFASALGLLGWIRRSVR